MSVEMHLAYIARRYIAARAHARQHAHGIKGHVYTYTLNRAHLKRVYTCKLGTMTSGGDTQMVMDTCSPSTPLAGPGVVGYLNVPPQGPIMAARNYPITEGTRAV